MSDSLVEAVAKATRRGFIGQLAAGSAAIVVGALGLSQTAEAHEERLTMVAGVSAREWGISSFQIRRKGVGKGEEQIVAELLESSGVRLGEFARTTQYHLQHTTVDDKEGKAHPWTKRFRKYDDIELAWATEDMRIQTDWQRGTFLVAYNGQTVGSATAKAGQQGVDPALAVFMAARGDLIRLGAAVASDIDHVFTEPVPEQIECCCEYNCLGSDQVCNGYGLTRTSACASSQACTNNRCTNGLCIGCCALTDCDCVCAPEMGDFFCNCISYGTACRCGEYCQ